MSEPEDRYVKVPVQLAIDVCRRLYAEGDDWVRAQFEALIPDEEWSAEARRFLERQAAVQRKMAMRCERCDHTWLQHGGAVQPDDVDPRVEDPSWSKCSACKCYRWMHAPIEITPPAVDQL